MYSETVFGLQNFFALGFWFSNMTEVYSKFILIGRDFEKCLVRTDFQIIQGSVSIGFTVYVCNGLLKGMNAVKPCDKTQTQH